jgi:ATPase subunit of ABC transporter with duplicated ATPase domains
VHEGNYSHYYARRAQLEAAAQQAVAREAARAALRMEPPTDAAPASATTRAGKRAKRGAEPAPRSVDQVEREITERETRLTTLENELTSASAASDVARVTELGASYEHEKALLDALYLEWQGLAS